jgi:hypothetical protein
MPEVEIKGKQGLAAEVTPNGVTLYKSGMQITASPENVAALQADGWLQFEADLDALAQDLGVWAGTLATAANEFAHVADDDGVIDTAEHAQLNVLVRAMRETAAAYNRLYSAAFIVHPVLQEAQEASA